MKYFANCFAVIILFKLHKANAGDISLYPLDERDGDSPYIVGFVIFLSYYTCHFLILSRYQFLSVEAKNKNGSNKSYLHG